MPFYIPNSYYYYFPLAALLKSEIVAVQPYRKLPEIILRNLIMFKICSYMFTKGLKLIECLKDTRNRRLRSYHFLLPPLLLLMIQIYERNSWNKMKKARLTSWSRQTGNKTGASLGMIFFNSLSKLNIDCISHFAFEHRVFEFRRMKIE